MGAKKIKDAKKRKKQILSDFKLQKQKKNI